MAMNAAGNGALSSIVNEQSVTINTVLHNPTGLTTSIPFVLGITVNWALPLNTGVGQSCSADCRPLTKYRLVVETTSGIQILNENKLPSITTHTISGLDHRLNYLFKIYSSNSAGESTYFAVISKQPVNYPTVPLHFVAVVSNSPYKIALTWLTPEDTGRTGQTEPILSYYSEVDQSVNSTFQAANVLVLCDGNTVVCTGLTCTCAFSSASVTFLARRFGEYHFRIKAKNQVGFGQYSFSSQQSVGVPSVVPSINASVTGVWQVFLKWIRHTDTGVGVGYSRSMIRYVVQRSYGDNSFSGCSYGISMNDQCSASTIGACCTDSSVPAT